MSKAILELKDGRTMNLDLMEQNAPISVQNFISLAKKGFYNDLVFHRVIAGFMIQGGGMNEKMKEKRADSIKGEFKSNGVNNELKHTAGTLSMARTSVKDSASSQFFICVADTPHSDGEYAAFGRCSDADSLKIAVDISRTPTSRDFPKSPVIIKEIKIID